MRPRTQVLVGMIVLAVAILEYWPHRSAVFTGEDMRGVGAVAFAWQPRSLAHLLHNTVRVPRHAHALSLALHLLNAALVGWLVFRLSRSDIAAWLATGTFALHPLAVEAVAAASARGELLAASGVVGACLFAAGAWWRPAALAGIGACLLVGVLGKESAIVGMWLVPLVARRRHRLSAINEIAWVVAMTTGIVASLVVLNFVNIGEGPGAQVTWWPWLQVQATAAVRLLSLTVVPWVTQTPDYDYDLVPHLWRLMCVGLLGGWAVLAWRQRGTLPGIGWLWMLLAIVPRLVVQTPRSYLNEHQWYLTLAGFACVVGCRLGAGERA